MFVYDLMIYVISPTQHNIWASCTVDLPNTASAKKKN